MVPSWHTQETKQPGPGRWLRRTAHWGQWLTKHLVIWAAHIWKGRKTHAQPTETEPEVCLSVSWGGVGQHGLLQGQGPWVQQTWVWHKPSWRRLPLTPPQSYQDLHRTGERDSWRAQIQSCMHHDPGERSSDPTRNWPRLAHECSGVSSRGVGWRWPAAGLGVLSAAVPAWTFWRRLPLSLLPPP